MFRRFSRACLSEISWSLKYSTIFTASGGFRSLLYIPKVSVWIALAASARFESQNRNVNSTARKARSIIFDCALWSLDWVTSRLRWFPAWHVRWNDYNVAESIEDSDSKYENCVNSVPYIKRGKRFPNLHPEFFFSSSILKIKLNRQAQINMKNYFYSACTEMFFLMDCLFPMSEFRAAHNSSAQSRFSADKVRIARSND